MLGSASMCGCCVIINHAFSEITGVEVFVSDEMAMRGLKNRGFCFVEFTDHRAAALGKKILAGLGTKVRNKCSLWSFSEAYCFELMIEKIGGVVMYFHVKYALESHLSFETCV